jgi:antitoxin (DNA-binding transcriptional repressor) of toxin-antitoxin stability system
MKALSIQALKAQLSSAVADAEAGATLLITRHNDPVAMLGPPRAAHLHRGRRVGTARLKPAVSGRPTKGRYLEVLLQDRGER